MTLPQDATVSLRLHLFGPFAVQVNGAPLPRLRSRKVQSLLALLTLRAGTEAARPWLAGLLWPDSPEGTALATLRGDLTSLRHALGAAADRLPPLPPAPGEACAAWVSADGPRPRPARGASSSSPPAGWPAPCPPDCPAREGRLTRGGRPRCWPAA